VPCSIYSTPNICKSAPGFSRRVAHRWAGLQPERLVKLELEPYQTGPKSQVLIVSLSVQIKVSLTSKVASIDVRAPAFVGNRHVCVIVYRIEIFVAIAFLFNHSPYWKDMCKCNLFWLIYVLLLYVF
jgi:hypothetical protein